MSREGWEDAFSCWLAGALFAVGALLWVSIAVGRA
jgi:hypothetical protein